ncbi:unnamed protein product, partial [Ectocarpus sp. 13 AM-2016]
MRRTPATHAWFATPSRCRLPRAVHSETSTLSPTRPGCRRSRWSAQCRSCTRGGGEDPHDEFLILATDGVWDVMDNPGIVSFLEIQ